MLLDAARFQLSADPQRAYAQPAAAGPHRGPHGNDRGDSVPQTHGDIGSLGFRFGGLAYSPDISDMPGVTLPLLQDLDVWIVDALRFTPHPSHFSVKQALAWIERLKPKRAILTHMTTDLDYETLRRELPERRARLRRHGHRVRLIVN